MWKCTRRKREQRRENEWESREKKRQWSLKGQEKQRLRGEKSNLLAADSSEKLHWGDRKCSFNALLWKPLAVVSILKWFCLCLLLWLLVLLTSPPQAWRRKKTKANKKNPVNRTKRLRGGRKFLPVRICQACPASNPSFKSPEQQLKRLQAVMCCALQCCAVQGFRVSWVHRLVPEIVSISENAWCWIGGFVLVLWVKLYTGDFTALS